MNLNSIPKEIPVFGDLTWRGECPLETPEMISGMQLILSEFPQFDSIMFHLRNEDSGGARKGKQLNEEGRVKGAADIVILCCPPIGMEVKRRDHTKSVIGKKQVKCLVLAHRQGAFSCVAVGALGMLEAVRAWHTINGK